MKQIKRRKVLTLALSAMTSAMILSASAIAGSVTIPGNEPGVHCSSTAVFCDDQPVLVRGGNGNGSGGGNGGGNENGPGDGTGTGDGQQGPGDGECNLVRANGNGAGNANGPGDGTGTGDGQQGPGDGTCNAV